MFVSVVRSKSRIETIEIVITMIVELSKEISNLRVGMSNHPVEHNNLLVSVLVLNLEILIKTSK